MAYIRKTRDEYVLLANYGYGHGWEEEIIEETYSEILDRLNEYRKNASKYSYDWKKRRVKIDKPK